MIKEIVKGVWAFSRLASSNERPWVERCSYLFVHQWGRTQREE